MEKDTIKRVGKLLCEGYKKKFQNIWGTGPIDLEEPEDRERFMLLSKKEYLSTLFKNVFHVYENFDEFFRRLIGDGKWSFDSIDLLKDLFIEVIPYALADICNEYNVRFVNFVVDFMIDELQWNRCLTQDKEKFEGCLEKIHVDSTGYMIVSYIEYYILPIFI